MPKLERWASPQTCTRIPELGPAARSAAIGERRAPVVAERRDEHAAVPDRNELRHAGRGLLVEEVDRIRTIRRRGELGMALGVHPLPS